MAKSDDAWFQSIKWKQSCIECQKETNGVCSRRSCAELAYDENGNYIPHTKINYDGDYKKLPQSEKTERKADNKQPKTPWIL